METGDRHASAEEAGSMMGARAVTYVPETGANRTPYAGVLGSWPSW